MKLSDRIKQAEEQLKNGEYVEWTPGMFTGSSSAKPLATSGKQSKMPWKPSLATPSITPK